jgi:hypothetical protein
MAGLFDFKSAEDILQERMAKTEQNRLQMLKDISQGAPRPDVARLGANLGYLLGKSLFGGKSEKEQLKETREMGETTQAMEQAGVGGEGSAQFDGEGSSYGAGVLQQAQAEEQRRLGLLSEDVQQAIGEERQAKQLKEEFSSVNMSSPEALQKGFKNAVAAGNSQLATLYLNMYKQVVENKDGLTAKDRASLYKDYTPKSIAAHLDNPNSPLVPIKEGGFTPESPLGNLFDDLEDLEGQPRTSTNQAAIAAIKKKINSAQIDFEIKSREFASNIVKDFTGKGNASEVDDWNKGIDLTTNLMSQYEGNPSKVRYHLNKYYRPYDGGFWGSSGFNVKEEYQKNKLTTPDGRAYYYDPDNKQFIGWVQ